MTSQTLRVLSILCILGTILVLPGVRKEYLGMNPLPSFIDPMTVAWVFILSTVFVFRQIPQHWIDNRVFRTLGELSFSVYLLHMAVIIGVRNMFENDLVMSFDRFLIVLLVTYGFAALVTRYFERPSQKKVLRALAPSPDTRATQDSVSR